MLCRGGPWVAAPELDERRDVLSWRSRAWRSGRYAGGCAEGDRTHGTRPSRARCRHGSRGPWEGLFFLEREGIELRAKDLAIHADQGGGEGGVAIEHGEDDLEGLAGGSVQIAIEVDHGAAEGHIGGGTADGGAVVEHDAGRDFHFDADGLASLLAFPGDGDGGADDDHVEESPEEIHGDGAEVVAIVETAEERERDVEGARDRHEETADVESQHEQEGWATRVSKKALLTTPPLAVTLKLLRT